MHYLKPVWELTTPHPIGRGSLFISTLCLGTIGESPRQREMETLFSDIPNLSCARVGLWIYGGEEKPK